MGKSKWVPKAVVVGLVAATAALVPVEPAAANVGISTSLTVPTAVEVGQSGLNGSLTVFNTNTAPHSGEGNAVTLLQLTPSCGTSSTTEPCPAPDLGVFTITTAVGAAGTACAAISFSPSAPDAQGSVVLTPSASVVLAPPGGLAGSDRCTVNFTYRVLRTPSIDSNPAAAGVQTRFRFRGQVTSQASVLTVTGFSSVEVTVNRASLLITTQASPSVLVGGTIFDTATLTAPAGAAAPTGTVTFQVFGPNDPACTSPLIVSTNPVVGGVATSNQFPTSQPGTYRFVAFSSGDANYLSVTSPCNAPNESVVVRRRVVADFDGSGTTDVSVFRPSTGAWYLRTPTPAFVQWGQNGDIPVPGDYDGNGTTDVAVFRPATGEWYLRTPTPALIQWGANGDVPAPRDYDGNGTVDVAVFRPASGAWYLRTATPVFVQWGQNGDVPAPGDYDGNGINEVAVFRPGTGEWYLRTPTPTLIQWGAAGDVPGPKPPVTS